MTAPEDWGALVPELAKWAEVTVLGAGRLGLTADGVVRELVLTPDQWGDIDGVIYGGAPAVSALLVREAWDRASPDDRFLVYDGQYDVQPSPSDTLPDESEEFRLEMERLRRENPDAEFGWFAYPPGDPRNES